MRESRELFIGAGAAGLGALALAALWSPGGWGPGWAPAALDILAALYLAGLTGVATLARLAAAKGRGEPTSLLGAGIIAAVFVAILAAFAAGALYALASKHGVYQPFLSPPNRIETLAFFANEALAGAAFDLLDVFDLSLPGAPAYDPHARWGFGLLVVAIRMVAALGVWSLIFAALVHGARGRRGKT